MCQGTIIKVVSFKPILSVLEACTGKYRPTFSYCSDLARQYDNGGLFFPVQPEQSS